MAQPVIAPININPSLQTEAAAGNNAVIFTSADRKVIKERTGQDEIDRTRSFRELFTSRELAPKVENEQTSVKPEQDVRVLEARRQQFRKMLKHSVITAPREHVELTGGAAPDLPPIEMAIDQSAVNDGNNPPNAPTINSETAAAMKQLNLDPAELFHKFELEQEELHALVYRIKDLHLKRLLSGSREEFVRLSEEIRKGSLPSVKSEAKDWLDEQLDRLTQEAAEYKLNLARSLQSIGLDKGSGQHWLETVASELKHSA